MSRARSVGLVAGLAAALVAGSALSQMPPGRPMGGSGGMPAGMPDPSSMSGIPRPDPQVPPGGVVVRAIRGDFAHPAVGQTITLDGPGGAHTAKTDEAGRATFAGLAIGGTYVARAEAWGQKRDSQPMQLPKEAGVKVLLVFEPDERALLGEHDGAARADKALPVGTIEISVVNESDEPVADLDVVLGHATLETGQKVDERTAKTDKDGRARFAGAKPGDGDAYIVAVRKAGVTASSQPFRLDPSVGMRLGLRVVTLARDATALSISKRSHLIVEVRDEVVQVLENISIQNDGAAPFDPGPEGLVFPLPSGAEGAQAVGDPAPDVTVEKSRVVVHGPIPVGEKVISFGVLLPYKDGTVDIEQRLPLPMPQLNVITDRFEGMNVEGTGLSKAEREFEGRRFWLVNGPAIAAGGELRLRLTGLPHASTTLRDGMTALSALILLWGLVVGFRSKRDRAGRAQLEGQREALLDELAALDAEGGGAGQRDEEGKDTRKGRRREELIEKLEQVYRQLDEADAGSLGGRGKG